MIRIYLASRYSRREEMEDYARQLQKLGYAIGSAWVFGNNDILGNPAEAKRFATKDRADILSSDLVLNFAEPKEVDYPRGSRHWEGGMAYERGKVCYVVGRYGIDLECIFHNLDGVVIFENWEEVLDHLKQLIIFEMARDTMRKVMSAVPAISADLLLANGDTVGRTLSDPGYSLTGIADRDNQDLL